MGGNKWHKLKANLAAALQQKHHTLLTFGGVWSNHIHAVAAAGKHFGFNTIGVIRGDEAVRNSNLEFATDCGMQLHFVDRKTYRNKHDSRYIKTLQQQFGDFYLLPEGGSNALAMQGCRDIVSEIDQPFDIITTACGTGCSLAGMISGLRPQQHAIGYAVLKHADFLVQDVTRMLPGNNTRWHIELDYHFGGYAKTSDALFEFMHRFERQHGFALDAVYTAKMFYGLFNDIEQDRFKPGTRIVAVHTGGLQGNDGFSPQINANKRK
jgi:1-aminocyclopropane-1-carboxylate deaminase